MAHECANKNFFCFILLLQQVVFAIWNHPYPAVDRDKNYYYTSFSEQPKTLDPARSYSSNEWSFIAQIYEPPLQYAYLKRPYELEPLTLQSMPSLTYYDKQRRQVQATGTQASIAYTQYDFYLKPNIFYSPHPAFVKDKNGKYAYHHLSLAQSEEIDALSDFVHTDTRALRAADYVYQIKRLADPRLHSPIYGLMSQYIVGLKSLHEQMQKLLHDKKTVNLRQLKLEGARALGALHYRILLRGYYPHFKYWLAMPFFSPIPWEVEEFYDQDYLKAKNITLNWYPVGTGAYFLQENNPNRQMVLVRNPRYHADVYPKQGSSEDETAGLLQRAGKKLPFIDKVIFSLEKENIPRWNKFLQGYYDRSGLGSESFSSAIRIDNQGRPHLSHRLKNKAIQLQTSVELTSFHIGFNMLDSIVGGYTKEARLLRRALSIAVNFEEYLQLFRNGRGIVAQSPLPPGIWGHQSGLAGMNPFVYKWSHDKAQRRALTEAKVLLAQAGFAHGIDPKTHRSLQLYFDVAGDSNPDNRALYAWLRKSFARLGIELHVRATQYNRFQQKLRTGQAQLFFWGWHADYPDPENFLFLLYGKNSKVKYGGENASNYNNPEYDRAF